MFRLRAARQLASYGERGMRRWLTAAVVIVAAITVGFQLWAAAGVTRRYAKIGWRNVRAPTPLVRDTDVDPLALYLSTGALVRAAQAIPRDASYTVVVGRNPPRVGDPPVVREVLRFWLYPRTYVKRISDAQWVIAYHESSESLGVRVAREIGLGPDANAVEVER